MPADPAFVPRDLLEAPDFFGVQEGVTWDLATDLPGALRLARAREQHELALAMHLLRLTHSNSHTDIAEQLGQGSNTVWRKLTGRVPAREEDLILWSWMTGEPRRNYPPNGLTEEPIRVPSFPMLRRRDQ